MKQSVFRQETQCFSVRNYMFPGENLWFQGMKL